MSHSISTNSPMAGASPSKFAVDIRFGLHSRKREASAKLHGTKDDPRPNKDTLVELSSVAAPSGPMTPVDETYDEMPIQEVCSGKDVFEAGKRFALARLIVASGPDISKNIRERFG